MPKNKKNLKLIHKIKTLLAAAFLLVSFSSFAIPVHADIIQDISSTVNSGSDGTELTFSEYTNGDNLELECGGLDPALCESTDLKEFIIKVVNFALGFLGLFAVLVVIYGGFLYVSSAGEQENTDKGKKAIMYAIIGILIILGSFALVNTVIKGVGNNGENGGTGFEKGAIIGSTFNASAVKVHSSAETIANGFVFFGQTAEEIRGIYIDAQKSSLDYTQVVVAKSEIMEFLYSVRSKLNNIRAKLPQFSNGYIRVGELLNQVELEIDKIQTLKLKSYYQINSKGVLGVTSQGPIRYEDVPAAANPTTGQVQIPTNTVLYEDGLYKEWQNIRATLLNNDPYDPESLSSVLEPIKEDYLQDLDKSLEELVQLKQSVFSSQVLSDEGIGKLYAEMMQCYGYSLEINTPVTACGTAFRQEVENWDVTGESKSLAQAGGALLTALEKQVEFSKALLALQSVQAYLGANVTEGNAPLVVTFSIVETNDPAGGTLDAKNIEWNLEGAKTLDGEEIPSIGVDMVECEISGPAQSASPADKEFFGTTFNQCIFKQPGTYFASAQVKSNSPNKYLPGQSSLVIRVHPPTTRINLDMELDDKQSITVMSYYDEVGLIKVDRDYVPVTLKQAKQITFDASGTENVDNYKWDFGDGTTIESDSNGVQPHSYENEGKYKATLEVINKLGEIDRKVFTIDVRNVAARIRVVPNDNIYIKTPIRFDGSLSSVSSGNIRSYEWGLSRLSGSNPEKIDLGLDANSVAFSYEFDEPGKYQVDLKVTSDLDSVNAEPIIFTVESKPPVAQFSYDVPALNQPSTVQFDAANSYDPDGTDENLQYEWSISPDSGNGNNWYWMNGTPSATKVVGKTPVIKFKNLGDYEITLKVIDKSTIGSGLDPEIGKITKTITVNNILDVLFADAQEVSAVLDENGQATINFQIKSDNAIGYEIDFGDGKESSGDMVNGKTVPHTYEKAGRFAVRLTVYDEEDNSNSITKVVFVSGGDGPIAKATTYVNGEEIYDSNTILEVTKRDILTFDASASKNSDGNGRNLKYSWDFGDGKRSTSKKTTHNFKDLSPEDPGYFRVILTIFDEEDPSNTSQDEIRIRVVNKAPRFSNLQATPSKNGSDMTTPLTVDVKAYGAEDPDGAITSYKWWYYNVNDPEDPLGMQITQNPSTKMTIGTNGRQGDQLQYGFGLEVTDNDGYTVSSNDILEFEAQPVLTVTNGPNEIPNASITVNTNKIYAGESVTFTSKSTDPDGEIVSYIWDFEGDGFFNNTPTDEATVVHVYDEQNLTGYNVRLKVIDDKGGEDTSDPFRIYVDTLAKPPTAAFTFEAVPGSNGRKIQFNNNSTSDTSAGVNLVRYYWDFDTKSTFPSADSNGDGSKDNDIESKAENPDQIYVRDGVYAVKLTVYDEQGVTDSVVRDVKIPLSGMPKAAFTYTEDHGEVKFNNTSTADASGGSELVSYYWDFDGNTDEDYDGNPGNDRDSKLMNPIHNYSKSGQYEVTFEVIDSEGNVDSVKKTINVDLGNTENPDDPGDSTTPSDLKAVLNTSPVPSSDGIIYLSGDTGTVTFSVDKSSGSISRYIFDKNIYFDTNKNGIKNDDQDFNTIIPITWTTNFDKSWGKTVVKFSIVDIYGNEDFVTQEIKFN